jgi:hypothetical protein
MARGWERKSVESQVEDRDARAARRDDVVVDPQREAARRTLELTLARAEAERAASTSPARRASLEQAIAGLRHQLESL